MVSSLSRYKIEIAVRYPKRPHNNPEHSIFATNFKNGQDDRYYKLRYGKFNGVRITNSSRIIRFGKDRTRGYTLNVKDIKYGRITRHRFVSGYLVRYSQR